MKNLLLLILLLTIPAEVSRAQDGDRNFGAGVIIGEPTGLSFAYWVSGIRSFSAGAAWSVRGNGNESLQIHVDYLFHHFDIVHINSGSMPLYVGVGGRLRFGDNEKAGMRIPLGAAYHFQNDPLEIFLELVPVIDLVPGTGISGNSGLGFRYYF